MDLELEGTKVTVNAEVAQQIGEGRVRCVCMQPTDGWCVVRRAQHRACIAVPVGNAVLGHVFNVLGKPLDTDSIGEADDYWEIHRSARTSTSSSPRPRCSRPHQGHRPARALRRGWQDRLFGGAGVARPSSSWR